MSKKIFVGGISFSTTEASLRDACTQYGEITDAVIITDRDTGRSRGFGFVTFSSEEAAAAAIQGLNNTDLDGRTIRVDTANERPERSDRGPRRSW